MRNLVNKKIYLLTLKYAKKRDFLLCFFNFRSYKYFIILITEHDNMQPYKGQFKYYVTP